MKRIVIALGGNALGKDYKEQKILVEASANNLLPLLRENNEIIITHGNGPQVGMINNSFDGAIPLDACTSMSQGYIGLHIASLFERVLKENNIKKEVCTLITRIVVDKSDPAFNNPTKPIGNFYSEEEAKNRELESSDKYTEDSGRGYRKVVASPKPLKIVEIDSIKKLLNKNRIIVTCGGGGIPVFDTHEEVEAVIDKDMTSALLAKELKADYLLILTSVNQVLINMGTTEEKPLGKVTTKELESYISDNQFGVGSMLPKIEASIDYVKSTNGTSIITGLENIENAIKGINSTIITK